MKRIVTLCFAVLAALSAWSQSVIVSESEKSGAFPLVSVAGCADIVVEQTEAEVVHVIAQTLKGDIEAVTGKTANIVGEAKAGSMPVIAGTIGVSENITQLVASGKLDVTDVEGRWEAYGLQVVESPFEGIGRALVVYGSQSRSTAYALLEVSREIGVSPWIWWADVTPKAKPELWIEGGKKVDSPSVKYRGIFINDEDFGLMPWAAQMMDTDKKNVGPKTYARVMELLLRLKANTLWPAMHACSAAFWYYKDNIPVAKRYDIYMGSSHCEQLLRDNEWEWNRYGGHYNDDWNWRTNRDMVQRYWTERVEESVGVNAIYTIGMRGVHDSPMNGYNSTSERVSALTEIIAWQRDLLAENLGDITKVPQLFIPYKEVLECYNAGLQVPDDVMLMWVDDNHGYIRQLPNATEQARSGGNAIYYHLSYMGTPSSYLWLNSISPSLCAFELAKAYEQGVNGQWIINVGDIKPAEEELEFCMDLAWDINSWTPENAWQYTRHWASRTFGEEYAGKFAEIKLEYYRLAAACKPEHIHLNTYTIEEMDARMAGYDKLVSMTDELKQQMPTELHDAYYQLLEYPVKGAALMNKKHFLARKSLTYAKCGIREEALQMAKDARMAYRQIVELTDKYNTGISGGKWNGMMSYHPQNYSQFYMPECASITGVSPIVADLPKADYSYVAGGDYTESKGGIMTIKGLGVSDESAVVWPVEMKAYSAAQAPYVVYDVPVKAGRNTISVRCLPTFPINSSYNLRVAISLDGGAFETKSIKTTATVGAWNQNVAQGYAPADVVYETEEDGTVKVKVALLDPGVTVSQIVSMPIGGDVSQLTKDAIVNYDFEMDSNGNVNDGTTVRGVPFGWSTEGKLNGNSYGINNDAVNYHGKNVCWMNSTPMPHDFKLYQVIPAEKLGKGTYKVSCMLRAEEAKKANCRLFANQNVQYFGYESDYTNLLTEGEIVTYAGYAGLPDGNMTLRDMEVYVTLEDGEDLEIGIKTSCRKNNNTNATDNAGWFKVDFFRIDKLEEAPEIAGEDLALTEANIVNYDFELYKSGNNILTNTSGETRRYTPYGWSLKGTFPGNSYGINKDMRNPNNINGCWFQPKEGFMPDEFELYQEIPTGQLPAGRYMVQCKLWVEENLLATTRLFANQNVQYYGMEEDYLDNLTEGENNTFAGYIGGVNGDFLLQDMWVYVDLKENEPLRIGIRSSNKNSDGTAHTDYKNGWFKTDYFRINRVDATGIDNAPTSSAVSDNNIYNLQGQKVGKSAVKRGGVYIQGGRKLISK